MRRQTILAVLGPFAVPMTTQVHGVADPAEPAQSLPRRPPRVTRLTAAVQENHDPLVRAGLSGPAVGGQRQSRTG